MPTGLSVSELPARSAYKSDNVAGHLSRRTDERTMYCRVTTGEMASEASCAGVGVSTETAVPWLAFSSCACRRVL
jgi:hypothetical protein